MNRDRSKGDFEKFCEPIKLRFCEALEFPSQAELSNSSYIALTFLDSKVLSELVMMVMPTPLE